MKLMQYEKQGEKNYLQALIIIDSLVMGGVKNVVISPGSRSTTLVLACERHPNIKTWIHIDERSACFFALGLATDTKIPTAIIATSGSAICNWLPAISEANLSHIPLLLLSADRPIELQKVGANQTLEQQNLLSSQVREFFQLPENAQQSIELQQRITHALSLSQWPNAGPVHVNIPIREPLLPDANNAQLLEQKLIALEKQIIGQQQPIHLHPAQTSIAEELLSQFASEITGQSGLIICGRDSYSRQLIKLIEALAKQLNCPIFADPLSNIRLNHSSENVIYNYDSFLVSPIVSKLPSPDWILRIGQLPISKNLSGYLQLIPESKMYLITPYNDYPDPLYLTDSIFHSTPEIFITKLLTKKIRPAKTDFLPVVQHLERQCTQIIQDSCLLDNPSACQEGILFKELIEQIKDGGLLFSANSMTIRDIDTFIHKKNSPNNSALKIFANRGCSGIDGNVSSFFGLLASSDKTRTCLAVLGDLTSIHDSNGFLWAKELQAQGYSATIIILNNHGGAIFNYLPQKQLSCFEKAWVTDVDLDFAQLAKLYQLHYQRVESASNFANSLTTAIQHSGISLIEVLIDQKQSLEQHTMLKNNISNTLKLS